MCSVYIATHKTKNVTQQLNMMYSLNESKHYSFTPIIITHHEVLVQVLNMLSILQP